ncbi:MAG TPA: ATP-binding protein, partial [Gemmatimonadales bacterium]|nr:ATP-binding protein [Gemmatimonadales bacterium]
RGTAELVPVDLGDVVRELSVTLRRLVPRAIEFRVDVPERALVAIAEAGGIEQLLVNLVTNARDAMPEGGTLRIELDRVDVAVPPPGSAAAPGNFIRLIVSDTGVGMDEATLRRIFEPFFTTKPAGVGTGLGMPVVEGLVRQHHGFLSIESTPGRGTTVSVHIPAADISVRPVERHRTLDPPRGSETILLVDDEDAIRRVGERLLVMLGYQVITARDGEEGLERWRQARDRIALVVSDLVMPRRGGREFYEAVVAESPDARFLFTSGYDPEEMDALQRVLPGVPILDKPWPAAALAQAVRHAIDHPPPRAPAA